MKESLYCVSNSITPYKTKNFTLATKIREKNNNNISCVTGYKTFFFVTSVIDK